MREARRVGGTEGYFPVHPSNSVDENNNQGEMRITDCNSSPTDLMLVLPGTSTACGGPAEAELCGYLQLWAQCSVSR